MIDLVRPAQPKTMISQGWSEAEREALVSALTRRRIMGASAAAGILAGIPASLRAQTPIATPASGTIDFTYLDLSFEVPANPQRVAVIEGRGDLEFAVIVGYPISASGNAFWPDERPGIRLDGEAPANLEQIEINDKVEVNFEQLVSVHPDLIIMRANGFRGDWYGNEQLAAIAPILAVEVNAVNWRQALVDQASILGRGHEIDPFLAAYDERLASARAEVEPLIEGKKVYFLNAITDANTVSIWGQEFGCSVAADLGMDVPVYSSGTKSYEISAEQLDVLADADLLIRQVNDPKQAQAMDNVPTWQALPAVQAGHVYDQSAQFNNGLAITARLLIDQLVQAAQLLKDA